MKTKIILLSFLCIFFNNSYAQENSSLLTRLRAISNNDIDFFNVDGIEITTQMLSGEFSRKNISKKFNGYSIKQSDLNQSDSSIGFQNFYLTKSQELAPNTVQNTSYYFVEVPNKGIRVIIFASVNKKDKELEIEFIRLLNNNSIPKTIYEPLEIDSINFAGRKIPLGSSCRWMGINNVQCPYYGQMNWSVHKTLEDASASVANQYSVINARKQGKIVSEEIVDVIFEGSEVKAKRVVFDLKGVTSVLVGTSGGKALTIYFVAAPVRQNFVSCVMSFWNNDTINPSGLTPLLEQIMKLKK